MHEVGIVYKRPLLKDTPKITNSQDVDTLMRKIMDLDTMDHCESCWVLLMSNSNHVLAASNLGAGGIKGVVVPVQTVFQLAIIAHASSIILVHNHPSGSLKPSESDLKLTSNVKQAAEFMSITLLDHLIITSEGYLSLADEGLL